MKARVLDLLFPLDVEPKPYFSKLVLRFGDSDSQIVAVVYFGGRSEIIRYSLAGISKGGLSQLIERMTAANQGVTAQEIAAALRVEVTRSPGDYKALTRALKQASTLRISPVLESTIALDDCGEYEYWYDTWEECVHYTLTCPFGNTPRDKLLRWMKWFRENLPNLLASPSALKP